MSELPFAVRLEKLIVHGVIDRLDDDGGDALITDYKLGAPSPDHHFQVSVYAWAARRVLGRDRVRARLVYLGVDPVESEMVRVDHDAVDAVVVSLDAALRAGEFRPNPGGICRTCLHRIRCPFATS
jgi:putative RecB family exonuclease